MTIGENVRALRTAKGWSTTELAERAGMSQSYISEIENGKAPGRSALQKLAGALGVSVSAILSENVIDSFAWFWRSRFATLNPSEIIQFRSAKVKDRVAWCLKQLTSAFPIGGLAERLQMPEDILTAAMHGQHEPDGQLIDQLTRLTEVPVNFLLNGDPGPIDEKVRRLLTDPDCGAWLLLFEKASQHSIPPEAIDRLLDSVLSAIKR